MVRDLNSYIEGILSGGQVLREQHTIPSRERAGEYLMMRLRIASGIDPQEYEQQYLLPFAPLEKALQRAREQGLAVKTIDGRWHLTPEGYLLSNTLISDLLLIQDECEPLTRRPQ
jgi:oxygen-independent coproporphyrinogen-3 oxidase